jgi:dynein heavy chain, axonemal
MLGYQGR